MNEGRNGAERVGDKALGVLQKVNPALVTGPEPEENLFLHQTTNERTLTKAGRSDRQSLPTVAIEERTGEGQTDDEGRLPKILLL